MKRSDVGGPGRIVLPRNFDRRGFLAAGGASLATLLFGACDAQGPEKAQRLLAYAERKNEAVERALFSHRSMDHARPGAAVAGDEFPSYFVSDVVPAWDAALHGAWRLEVAGMVRRPLSLSLDDLMRIERKTQRVNHYCVEGWTAVAEFTGAPLRTIADLAGADPRAGYVDFQSFDDGYHESWDVESATHPQTLIVYAKDGALLSPAYGAPARVHSPVKLGYKNTKYLTRVVFMPERNGGYWTDMGYEWYGGV
ncbi:MAG TPA: molybdopterin-dependent oxidoreductase [Gemmatimonadaceae bacterium]|nr:molybdopterin-dependent oxidoreductase [Gemmatimonadaceae bacterium]